MLQDFLEKVVTIVTNDGRNIVGTLKGFDQVQNLILADTHERVYSEDKGVSQQILGLYIVRGDTIALIAELDEDKDSTIDLSAIRAVPLKPIVH